MSFFKKAWFHFLGFFIFIILQGCSKSDVNVGHLSQSLEINEATAPNSDYTDGGVAGYPIHSSETRLDFFNSTGFIETLKSFALYSPARFISNNVERLFVGGWVHPDDYDKNYHQLLDKGISPTEVYGPDKIWTVERPGLNLSENISKLKLALALKGYHVNDPTFIVPPNDATVNRSTWVYMYFTMLDNQIPEYCRQRKIDLLNCSGLFQGHDIGFAVSQDYGANWTYLGKIIDHKEVMFNSGAWTPSAVLSPDQKSILLYYSTGSQDFSKSILNQVKLSLNGWQILSSSRIVKTIDFRANHPDYIYANPEIKYLNVAPYGPPNNRYVLTYNNSSQTKILIATSLDGINFGAIQVLNQVTSSTERIVTPNLIAAKLINGQFQTKFEFAQYFTNLSGWSIFTSK